MGERQSNQRKVVSSSGSMHSIEVNQTKPNQSRAIIQATLPLPEPSKNPTPLNKQTNEQYVRTRTRTEPQARAKRRKERKKERPPMTKRRK